MSEEYVDHSAPSGPPRTVMLAATSMLKSPRAVTNLKVVARTASWVTVFSTAAGALLALLLYAPLFGFGNITVLALVVAGGGFVGWALSEWSPLKGESFAKWVGIKARSTTAHRVEVNGERIQLYIGTFPIRRVAQGRTRLTPSGIEVEAVTHDERGYPQLSQPKSSDALLREQRHRRATQSTLKAGGTLTAPPAGKRRKTK